MTGHHHDGGDPGSIRVAAVSDLPRLAATLAGAFEGDPVWTWMLPGGHRSRERLFRAILGHAIPYGHVYTAGDGAAVAMWAPPGAWRLPLSAMLCQAVPVVRAAGWRVPRVLGRLSALERLHEQVPPAHWYLEYIGTSPAAQGAGLGSALLRHAQAHVIGGLPVYLESSNPRNLPFYLRHGFTVTGERAMRSGPPQWTLWRE